MGSRTNVAIRQHGAWSHCGGNGMGYSLDAWLALGPGPAVAVLTSFPVWERDEWETESVCEAGALVDLDAKDLLVFLNVDFDQRRADLDAYRRTWAGWTVRWAYNGISDVTDALGVDRALVRREPWENTDLFRWGRPESGDEPGLGCLVTTGGRAYGLSDWAVAPWQVGPALLDQLTDVPQMSAWWAVPRGGMHLDVAARTAGVWSVQPVLGLAERFEARWPGWTLEFWEDRFEEQQQHCGAAFRFPDPADAVELCGYQLVRRVVQHWAPAATELHDGSPPGPGEYDPHSGTQFARLSLADLQRLGELLIGPDRDPASPPAPPAEWPTAAFWTRWATDGDWSRPLDVAAYARKIAR